MELFKATDIVKQFSNHRALNKVSISVPENSIFGLLGPNGAGKTTLIRIINQITAPDEGELYFGGRKMKADDIYQIGYLPEERGLYKKMKVGEQALYLAQLKGLSKNDAMKKLKYLFQKFEIIDWWNKKVEELSKGMQQKIQFITTIIHEPKLLIFDEPFSGFDPINANLLKNEILELKSKGATIIFSTHNMSSVEELCDHISLINKSEVILEGQIYDIKKTYRTNVYELSYQGDPQKLESSLGPGYELLSNKTNHHVNLASIKASGEDTDNRLLKELIKHVTVVSFNELIPSMNDVFIRVVEETNKKNQVA
ncbi:MAG: ABC transporter ATP-binding protein [Bacteroidales bacterium]|nr:ABC transporter ATP-binding protein [Bacteroidales bacterium]MCB9013124.1 ABC transporter ATP-binding protein [Bacteroidales bacterium]